jgi:broad specificity phosphatase PhoE
LQRLFLARHGRSEWNGQARVTGQLDVPLTPEGRKQAEILAQLLRGEPLCAVFASPLARAHETARPTALAHGLPVQRRDELMEVHRGILQGRFHDDRDPQAREVWRALSRERAHYRVPNGESFVDMESRVLACLEEILGFDGESALVVGHTNPNRVILATLLGWPRQVAVGVPIQRKFLYEITVGHRPRVRTIRIDAKKPGRTYDGFRASLAEDRFA